MLLQLLLLLLQLWIQVWRVVWQCRREGRSGLHGKQRMAVQKLGLGWNKRMRCDCMQPFHWLLLLLLHG